MNTTNKYRVTFAAFSLLGTATATPAESLYSVDIDTQTLVTIDTESAAITEIGVINENVAVIDLAMNDGRLYGIDSAFPNGANLIEIDTATGVMLSSVPVTISGSPAVNAIESLSADAEGLVIGMWNDPDQNPTLSNFFGRIGLNGAVTDLSDYKTDFDGLGYAGNGTFISVDRDPNSSIVILNEVMASHPDSLKQLDEIAFSELYNGVDDPTVSGGMIYLVDRFTYNLHRHDRATGRLLESIPYDDRFRLSHLQRIDRCPADLNNDGMIDSEDLNIVLGDFGCAGNGCTGDTDGDGATDSVDLNAVLGQFGDNCGG